MMVCVMVRGREVLLIPIVIAIRPDIVRLMVGVTPVVVTIHLYTRPPVHTLRPLTLVTLVISCVIIPLSLDCVGQLCA